MKRKETLLAVAVSSLICFACAGGSPPVAVPGNVPVAVSPVATVPLESPPAKENTKTPAPESVKPQIPVRFFPKPDGDALLVVPPGVGAWTSGTALSAARRTALSAAFRDAYLEALARGIGLTGVLGGDLVHLWTPPSKKGTLSANVSLGAFVQNWRETGAPPNSWGLKNLAIAGLPIDGSRAFIIRGALLDAYGSGEGIGGANGIAGYGAPLGDEFSMEEGRAQRFEQGLLVIQKEGTVAFLQETAPSSIGVPESVGVAPIPLSAALRNAFRGAWSAAVDSGRVLSDPDGPVVLSSGPWGSAYIQTFASASWGIVLPMKDAAVPVSRARILDRPFLEAVSGKQGSAFNFNEYGLPISDSFVAEGIQVQIFEKGRLETVR